MNKEKNDSEILKNNRKKQVKTWIKFFDFLLVLFFVFVSIMAILQRDSLETFLTAEIYQYGYMGLFFINLLLDMIPQIIAPAITFIPALLSGLNVHFVVFIVVSGSFIGSFIGYDFGKRFGFSFLKWALTDEDLDKIMVFVKKYGNIAIFLAAVTPLPYVPLIFGALNVQERDFVFYGMIPRAIGLIAVGYSLYLGIV